MRLLHAVPRLWPLRNCSGGPAPLQAATCRGGEAGVAAGSEGVGSEDKTCHLDTAGRGISCAAAGAGWETRCMKEAGGIAVGVHEVGQGPYGAPFCGRCSQCAWQLWALPLAWLGDA